MPTVNNEYPFVKELITDSNGNVVKVILDNNDYKRLIEELEDEGLFRAMKEVQEETPISIDRALDELEK